MFKFKKAEKRTPTLAESVASIAVLVVLITVGFIVFKWPVAMMMIVAAVFAGFLALRCGYEWKEIELAIGAKFGAITPVIIIIFFLGAAVASFIFSGTIPYIVMLAINILNPTYIYVATFLACTMMASATGGSWSTAATMGMAMFGVAVGMEANLTITAAAAISGSFWGDKMAPLSETTNLAPLCAGTTLYQHIGSMMWTSVPSAVVCIIVYTVLGMNMNVSSNALPQTAVAMLESLNGMYHWSILLLLPFAIIVVSAIKKAPAIPTMVLATFSALLIGVFYQGFSLTDGLHACIDGMKPAFLGVANTSEISPQAASLVTRGGMKSLAGTIIVIYSGFVYSAIVSHCGFLQIAVQPIVKLCRRNPFTLVLGTIVTDGMLLACSGSSYPAHIITGEIFRKEYADMGIDARVLSRSMEDFGTVGSPLIPWTGSGAYMAGLFGIAAYGAGGWGFLAINAWMNTVVALILAATGIGMYRMTDTQKTEALARLEAEKAASI